MIKFHRCNPKDSLFDSWIDAELNVLMIGEKGVGKTHLALDAFKRNNLKYAYFSGATLDPWIHLLGIPKAKVQEDGSEKMEFILPHNLSDDVEAIFCDEWNRTNKVVRNALLELQQFKSINGRKFPNLKVVWGAINPPKDDTDDSAQEYDVDEMDPAQLDRFHIIIELPNEPNKKFFNNKFGEVKAKALIDWWKEQSLESKKILSPRRLEYLGDCFNKGLDIRYLLPTSANASELIKELSIDGNSDVSKILENPTNETMASLLGDEKTVMKYKRILKEEKYWKYWKYIKNKEFLIQEIKMNEQFAVFAVHEAIRGEEIFKDALKDVHSTNPEKSIFKVMDQMRQAKYVIPLDEDIEEFLPKNAIPFSTLSKGVERTDLPSGYFGNFTATANTYSIEYMSSTTIASMFENICNIFEQGRIIQFPRNVCAFGLYIFGEHNTAQIKDKNKIVPFMGDIIRLSKKHLTPNELEDFIKFIEQTKLSQNRKDEYVKYLKGETIIEKDPSPMSEQFLRDYKAFENKKKVKTGFNDIYTNQMKQYLTYDNPFNTPVINTDTPSVYDYVYDYISESSMDSTWDNMGYRIN